MQAAITVRPPGVRRGLKLCGSAAALLFASLGVLEAQTRNTDLDTVRAGRFDNGKMWTFEDPPEAYFTETYGFSADEAWFRRARLSVLRIPGCSASFVSPNGLVATNHHCVRGAVSRASRAGENLLDSGFYAATLEEERPLEAYFADHLISIEDVSDEVLSAHDRAGGGEERNRARRAVMEEVRARGRETYGDQGDSVWVQVVPLYNGGRYSAYVFRRFTDVRLVQAVELELGFFGGDPDNFTYPRYALDFAFLRIYVDGAPYRPEHHFTWSQAGVEEGDVVFVIGNPGQTNRLRTMAQLEYQRDIQVPALIGFLRSRLDALEEYRRARPEEAEALEIRNRMFGLSNSLKASTGRLEALGDPVIMARKRDAERKLSDSIRGNPELEARYEGVFERLAGIQVEKAEHAAAFGALVAQTSSLYASSTLRRALAADAYLEARAEGAPADSLELLALEIRRIGDQPPELERRLLAARFTDFERYFGANHEITRAALQGVTPAEAADALLAGSVLADSAAAAALAAGGPSPAEDPALRLVAALLPISRRYRSEFNRLLTEENELAAQLGRARFAIYGGSVPPDGTFSPRITDGVVRGFEYNGTLAPPYTTFYGLYDRHYGHAGEVDWALPGRWSEPPAGLDLSTPLNFVSTADTYGGNSGSPAVTPDQTLVGLNFDRNIQGLSRDFIYLPERGRNVMVDVRAIRAALDEVYDADRIVEELETGRLFETEAEADAAAAGR
ncbi:MAG: S46 family peptidase [Gemmatimonadota bacterium]